MFGLFTCTTEAHRRTGVRYRAAMQIDSEAAAVVAEVLDAADALQSAMYNSDLEVSWRRETERWHAAVEAAERLPGVKEARSDEESPW
jgi:hypothetical protein